MRVVKQRRGGIIHRVELVDDGGQPLEVVCRFLSHLADRGYSPHTLCAYCYDLRHLFVFLERDGRSWSEFGPADALRLLGYLRRLPSRGPAQRLGLGVVDGEAPARRLSPATVTRVLAAVSSFYDWAITAEESPIRSREDPAAARVPERHTPFMGRASRQRPVRRTIAVKVPLRLPRPLPDEVVEAFLGSLTRLRDLAMFLLMLDGGLRPGEVLSLHLEDVSYGRRRVAVRKRDDHPRGVRGKSRAERMVDLHEPRTLDSVSRYIMTERPSDGTSPFVFLVGGRGRSRAEPLSYDAVVRLFARRMAALGLRTPRTTPHALRHTHATAMWERGMRELTLQKRLGHASPESTKVYTRVSDEAVLAEYTRALGITR